jgi:hypothetical protein
MLYELEIGFVRMSTGFIWLRILSVAGSCECDNKFRYFMKGGKFLDQLSDY